MCHVQSNRFGGNVVADAGVLCKDVLVPRWWKESPVSVLSEIRDGCKFSNTFGNFFGVNLDRLSVMKRMGSSGGFVFG